MNRIKYLFVIVPMMVGLVTRASAQTVNEIRLSCPNPGAWTMKCQPEILDEGREILHVTLDAPTRQVPPTFTLSMMFPQHDIHHTWSSEYGYHNQLRADWSSPYTSQLASNLPLYALINDNNRNRLTIATNEALRYVEAKIGLREEGCNIIADLTYFKQPEAPISHYEVSLLLDKRDQEWGKCVTEGVNWIRKSAGLTACSVPGAAEDPLYSSWYQFHQEVFDQDIEAECRLAKELGMNTIIVDDGWQTDDNNRGYAYCGDWEVSKRRFPDMAAHVKKVHDIGMKYMMWYSVPFMGVKSKNYEHFKDKFLYFDQGAQAGVLDPRFPEVRQFLIGIYEKAMKDWDIDGFKLDFIDSFRFDGADPAIAQDYAGRDIQALPEAINVLLREVREHLTALKPDVLIEYRQSYIGPAICQYGNMLRSGDCPGDLTTNRCHIAALRLTSGPTAVHADMLEWNAKETPTDAARAILSALFGVVQYSVMLREASAEQKAVIKHWLDFSQQHRQTLLHGEFQALHPERDYPLLLATGKDEQIIGLYQDDVVVPVTSAVAATYILNGAGGKEITLNLTRAAHSVTIYDTYGKEVGKKSLPAGISQIEVPRSGYVLIQH